VTDVGDGGCRQHRNGLTSLRSAPATLRGFLLAADVGHLVQHIADPTRVDDIGRRNLMLKLPGPVTQPNINSFLEGELGFSRIVVLNDRFNQGSVPYGFGGAKAAPGE
jgi:hypothetical protein